MTDQKAKGFSLVEVLVAMSVLAIIITVALDAISNVTRDQLLNNLRIKSNQTARDTLMMLYRDLQTAGYQLPVAAGTSVPAPMSVLSAPYRLTIRCTRRVGRIISAAGKGDTELVVDNASEYQGLLGGYLIYTFEGVTQVLRVTSVGSPMRFTGDPLKIGLPAGTAFAAVDKIEYIWQSKNLTRRINGSVTDSIAGIENLSVQFVLNDGSVVTAPTSEQADKVRYADCSIGVRLERRASGGQTYASTASTSQRVAVLNNK